MTTQRRPRHAFDIPAVQAFLASLPADEERTHRLQALIDVSNALEAARARDGELTAEIATNTEALVQASGKDRERLFGERARHAAERDALPNMLENLTRRYAEAVIAACHYVHRQATEMHDQADAVIAEHVADRVRLADAWTRFDSQSRYQDKADATRAELRDLDTRLQPYRVRREEARTVLGFIEHTLNQLLGEGQHVAHVRPESIDRYVQRSTRKVA